MTDQLRQAAQQALEAWDDPMKDLKDMCGAMDALRTALEQQAEPVQKPFDDLATELFVVAQRSPADEGFSDTIDRIESWLREHFSTPPQRKPLTCAWSPEDDDTMPGTYRSACGELWSFIDGGWKDNRVNFCHGCGGKVIEAAHGIKGGT